MGTVCASEYGGPSDPTSGTHGYHGDDLTGRMAFAELGMGTALGGLPYKYKLRIDFGGRSVVAEKLDIGLGGPGCGGHGRAIDLWWETARALGFSGLAPVNVTGGPQLQTQTVTPVGFRNTESLGELVDPFNVKPFEKFGEQVGGVGEFFSQFVKLLKLLTSREGWIRIGKVTIGLFLLLAGILGMANIQAGGTVVGAGTKVGKVGVGIAKGKV